MKLNQEQLQSINCLTDTILYKEAGALAGKINTISSTQLNKIQQLIDGILWQSPGRDVSVAIGKYIEHQSNKKTKNYNEQQSFSDFSQFFRNDDFIKIIGESPFISILFPHSIAKLDTPAALYIKNTLFKEFMFHFIQEMKFKGREKL